MFGEFKTEKKQVPEVRPIKLSLDFRQLHHFHAMQVVTDRSSGRKVKKCMGMFATLVCAARTVALYRGGFAVAPNQPWVEDKATGVTYDYQACKELAERKPVDLFDSAVPLVY